MTAILQSYEQKTTEVDSPFAREWPRYDRMFIDVETALLDAAELKPGDGVLDVGCGAGGTSLAAAARVGTTGRVLGVDINETAVAVARDRAERLALRQVSFLAADVTRIGYVEGGTDRIISRFGTLHFPNPVKVFTLFRCALRNAGRLCFVAFRGAERNAWAYLPQKAMQEAALAPPRREGGDGPFGWADRTKIERTLDDAGFREIGISELDLDVCLGDDVDDAWRFFELTHGRRILPKLGREAKENLREHMASVLRSFASKHGVYVPASIWLVTAAP